MPQLTVTVKRLNKRRVVPMSFSDSSGIIGEVKQGFSFDGTEAGITEVPNRDLGKWFKDRDGYFYWGGGLVQADTTKDLLASESREIEVSQKKSFQWFKDLQIEEIWNGLNEFGDNAIVAVLDTGYDTNNTDLPVPLASKLFVNNSLVTTTIQDKLWHGTFCTSLIACRNKTINIGLAPQCKTLIGKVSIKGELADVNIILDAMEWAIQSGAEIISISIGLPLTDQRQIAKLQDRYDQITSGKNIFVFAACGDADNDSGQIISKEFYPASLNNCISIGTVVNDIIANVTVRSNRTVIHTLGVDIEAYMLDNAIEKQTGTSMSVPIVAGVMSLAVSLTKKKNNGKWNKDVLLKKLIETGKPIAGLNDKIIIDPLIFLKSL